MPHRANRTFVSNSDALTAWAPIARDVLLDTAHGYRATVSSEVLAAEVQGRSGIAADQPADVWIDKLLERVAKDAESRGEPRLASLCPRPGDGERDAADRFACYQAYADDLPDDGGSPAPIIRVAPVRTSRAPARTERRPATPTGQMKEVTCTSCWMIVPARETCQSCGAAL